MSIYQRTINLVKLWIPYDNIKLLRKIFDKNFELKDKIRTYFLTLNRNVQNTEIIEIIDYFENNIFSFIPYEFTKKYLAKYVSVFYDRLCKMYFVLHKGKKLYFPEGWDRLTAAIYYNGLLQEQDMESPHRYETEEFVTKEGEVIADIGTAEGIWALAYAEKAVKIYLFECEEQWIKALKKTFEPWQDKVVIVNKYVSNSNNQKETTIDEYFKNKRIDLIKADIEGAEIKLLEGGKEVLLRDNNLKLLLCTYHKKYDGIKIKEILEKNGFITEYSKGYVIYLHDKELEEPYVRRGLIRAKKIITRPRPCGRLT